MRELQFNEMSLVACGATTYCGPAGSWLSNFIPDSPFGFNFSEACQYHDIRYTEAYLPRNQVDSLFLQDMLDVAGNNIIGMALAYAYYAAAYLFGSSSYGPQNASQPATVSMAEGFASEVANSAIEFGVEDELGDLAIDFDSTFSDRVEGFGGFGGGGGSGDDPWFWDPQGVQPRAALAIQ